MNVKIAKEKEMIMQHSSFIQQIQFITVYKEIFLTGYRKIMNTCPTFKNYLLKSTYHLLLIICN